MPTDPMPAAKPNMAAFSLQEGPLEVKDSVGTVTWGAGVAFGLVPVLGWSIWFD